MDDATSKDSAVIDDDLVEALGFEPTSSGDAIVIVDDDELLDDELLDEVLESEPEDDGLEADAEADVDEADVDELEAGPEAEDLDVDELDAEDLHVDEADVDELDVEPDAEDLDVDEAEAVGELDVDEAEAVGELDVDEAEAVDELDVDEPEVEPQADAELDAEDLDPHELDVDELDVDELDVDEADVDEADVEPEAEFDAAPPPPTADDIIAVDALGGAVAAGVLADSPTIDLTSFDTPLEPLEQEIPTQPPVAARAPSRVRRRKRIRARKARRVVRHIDPWSVLTFSVIFHLCVFAALLLSSVLVWNAAVAAGTIDNIESFIIELGDYETFEINGDVVFRAAVVIAGMLTLASSVLVVLLTVVFNLISDLVGGIRVTVLEEETVRVPADQMSSRPEQRTGTVSAPPGL